MHWIFFDHIDDLYGVDPNGPVSTEDADSGGVEIPQSPLRFSDRHIQILKQTIDPYAPSDNYGIDIYMNKLYISL